jgi:hypothetical protein
VSFLKNSSSYEKTFSRIFQTLFVLVSAESAGEELHPQHYLMLLLKRHLVGLYSTGRAHHTNSKIFKRLLLHRTIPPPHSFFHPLLKLLLVAVFIPFDAPSNVCNVSLLMLLLMFVPLESTFSLFPLM